MNRVEELTLNLLDGVASASDLDELDLLTAESESEAQHALGILRIERVLRAEAAMPDLSAAIVSSIETRRGDRIADNVIQIVSKRTRARRGREPLRLLWAAMVLVFGLMGVGYAAWYFQSGNTGIARNEADNANKGGETSPPSIAAHSSVVRSAGPSVTPSPNAESKGPLVVFFEDFDTASMPLSFPNGRVADDPAGNGARRVGQGTTTEYEGATALTLHFENLHRQVAWSDNMTVEFDCWLSGANTFAVLVYNPVRQQNYERNFPPMPPDRWVHFVLRFADLRPVSHPEVPAQEGDRLENIAFSTVLGGAIFIDNVEIRR
jgi:hypothetical protein